MRAELCKVITARQKVLSYFDKSQTASAREIARALKMSAATVRHHLRVLAGEGRLELASVRGREARGRPEKLYALPRAALGDNFPALSEALLAEAGAGSGLPGNQPDGLGGDGVLRMEALARRMAGGSNLAGQPLARRLNLAVEKLNHMHYHAHWEAGPEGPRIIFGHCPYAAIIEKHPELCRMDQAMLQEWMGQPAAQVFRTGKEGSSVCVFTIGRSSS
jgi:predicted ArsR family transcriptional regulator